MRSLLVLATTALLVSTPSAVRADDYEFSDPATGKVWSPTILQISGTISGYDYATNYAANFASTSYTDWRLPTLAELQQAAANGTLQRINTTSVFPPFNNATRLFWSTTRKGNKQWTLRVHYDTNGNITSYDNYLVLRGSSYLDAFMVRP